MHDVFQMGHAITACTAGLPESQAWLENISNQAAEFDAAAALASPAILAVASWAAQQRANPVHQALLQSMLLARKRGSHSAGHHTI